MEANYQTVEPGLSIGLALRAIHRLEVAPMYAVVFVWSLFLGAGSLARLATVPNILTLLINVLLLFGGFVLNSWADYPIDSKSRIKNHVARAVKALGPRATLFVFVVETLVALVLAAVVTALIGSYAFFGVTLLGVFSGILYNAEPVRLKRRGLWNPAMMALRFGFVPGFLAYVAASPARITSGVWLLLIGMTLASFSRGFWNCVSDTNEDAAVGIRTPAVVHGPALTTRVAIILLAFACAFLLWGLWILLGAFWAFVGSSGAILAFLGRLILVMRVSGDKETVQLLGDASVRAADSNLSLATYYLFLVPCLVVLFT